MEDKETREQYHEMIREKNKLKERQRKTNTAAESDSDSSGSDDEDELKEKAVREIKEEISDSEGSEQSSSDGDDEIKMDFKEKKTKTKKKDEPTGIMNMKFMKTAEKTKQEKLKNDAKMLVDQIENSDQSEEEGGLFNTLSKFSKMSSKFGAPSEKAP